MLIKLTAQEVFDRLNSQDSITQQSGEITFKFGGISFAIKQRDVVGNIIQEWVKNYFLKNNIAFDENENTQMPPDFFLDPSDKTHNLLEIKTFNYNAGPGFDIADFNMYQREIVEKPYMLFVDYLIFGYTMNEDSGEIRIEHIWLKKVWEITRRMKDWPINLQIKKKVVHKIRRGVFYSKVMGYPMFRSLEDFLAALEETVYRNSDTRKDGQTFRPTLCRNFKKFYGKEIKIPRWQDIENSYDEQIIKQIRDLQSEKKE